MLIWSRLVLLASFVAAGSMVAVARANPPPPAMPAQYTLAVDVPAAKVGAAATAHVKLTPGAGYHVNKDYPTSLKLVAPEGVALVKANLAKSDGKVEESGASFDVAYTASAPGKKTILGTLKFAVCTASTCDPRSAPVSFTVDVK